MPPPLSVTKPLLLIFPLAQPVNYERCLVIANHLRSIFDIRFLHTDSQAGLVYQHGFDTFSNTSFSSHLYKSGSQIAALDEKSLEIAFLEQVEMLETLQPALIIGDGISSLRMAAEFTGIPLIAILNGHQSSYYANEQHACSRIGTHNSFEVLRERYGLLPKHMFAEELEGDLNWICDLPELFPQKELPFHFVIIGPLLHLKKQPVTHQFDTLNPYKKTILIDIDLQKGAENLLFLNSTDYRRFNLVADAAKSNQSLAKQIQHLQLLDISQVFPKTSLLLCNSERLVYNALLHEVPVLFTNRDSQTNLLIEALENLHLGTSLNMRNINSMGSVLDQWANFKQTDAYRPIQYKIKAATVNTSHRLFQSIALHFPSLEKKTFSFT